MEGKGRGREREGGRKIAVHPTFVGCTDARTDIQVILYSVQRCA